MARHTVTTRLTEAQTAVLKRYAEQQGMTFYRATAHALERGLAAMVGEPEITVRSSGSAELPDEIGDAIGTLQAQVDRSERFAKQSLFAAGAAYAAIVAMAKSTMTPDDARAFDTRIGDEAARVFERQAAKALED